MKTNPIPVFLVFLILSAIFPCSRVIAQSGKDSRAKTYTKTVQAQGASTVKVELTQAAGILKVSPGTGQLMDATFVCSKDVWNPKVAYTQQNNSGTLMIKQPDSEVNMQDEDRNDWQIRFSNATVLDMYLKVGAGQSNIDLHGMKISNLLLEAGAGDFTVNLANTSLPELKVNAGVGAVKVDLTGKWSNNLNAEINGGIGEITLILPKNTGVQVEISGLGSVEGTGFKKQDGYYVNNAYGKGGKSLMIEINGGLGSVNLELEK
jgi:hypothetical protein